MAELLTDAARARARPDAFRRGLERLAGSRQLCSTPMMGVDVEHASRRAHGEY
jgi:hypothetical protein